MRPLCCNFCSLSCVTERSFHPKLPHDQPANDKQLTEHFSLPAECFPSPNCSLSRLYEQVSHCHQFPDVFTATGLQSDFNRVTRFNYTKIGGFGTKMSNRVVCREASHAGSWYSASGNCQHSTGRVSTPCDSCLLSFYLCSVCFGLVSILFCIW